MKVTVTNLDNTETPYIYEPSPGRLDSLIEYYQSLANDGNIRAFVVEDDSGLLASYQTI